MPDTLVLHLLADKPVNQAVLTYLGRTNVVAQYDAAVSPVTAMKHSETVLLLPSDVEEDSDLEASVTDAWFDAYNHDWPVHWVGEDGYHHTYPEPLVVEKPTEAPKKNGRKAPAPPRQPRQKKETPPDPVVEEPTPVEETPVEAPQSHQEETKPLPWREELDMHLMDIQQALGGIRDLLRRMP